MATNPNSMVQEAVDAAISKRGEIGLQVVAYMDGKQVVDVWGGLADITAGRQVDARHLAGAGQHVIAHHISACRRALAVRRRRPRGRSGMAPRPPDCAV